VRSGILFNRPHPPSPSPKEKERRCIANPNFIFSISTLILYSTFSESRTISAFSKSKGCALFLSFGEAR